MRWNKAFPSQSGEGRKHYRVNKQELKRYQMDLCTGVWQMTG